MTDTKHTELRAAAEAARDSDKVADSLKFSEALGPHPVRTILELLDELDAEREKVARLEKVAPSWSADLRLELINERDALKAENARLVEAVKDLLSVMDYGDEDTDFSDDESVSYRQDVDGNRSDDPMTFGHIRRVRAALTEGEE